MKNLDPQVVRRVYETIHRYADTGHGDIKKLEGTDEYRLRVGDWRVRFDLPSDEAIRVLRVLHRSEAYR